jgi:hypothetical protein
LGNDFFSIGTVESDLTGFQNLSGLVVDFMVKFLNQSGGVVKNIYIQ